MFRIPAVMTCLIVVLTGTAAIVGCGGGGGKGGSATTAAEQVVTAGTGAAASDEGGSDTTAAGFESCLRRTKPANVSIETATEDLKVFIRDAGDGALEVHWPSKQANIAVERSDDDAENREAMIKAYVERFGMSSELVRRDGTVVIQYTAEPTDKEEALIEGCL